MNKRQLSVHNLLIYIFNDVDILCIPPIRYDVKTVYQAVLLTLERLVEDEAVQVHGVVAILDWSNFPARLTTSLSPKMLRLMLDGLQVSYNLHDQNDPRVKKGAI